MPEDHNDAENVLAVGVDAATEIFGPRLRAAFALGSLAHGGFAPLASDVDLALVIDGPGPGTAHQVARVKDLAVARSSSVLAERLSVFWSDWDGVRGGTGPHCRLPAVDRLDLLDDGRLLRGSDERASAIRPGRVALIAEGAAFACHKFDDAFLADLREPGKLVAAGPRATTKAVLFPVRFLYTLASGRIGHNGHAAQWYSQDGAHPALVEAAMGWRTDGMPDTAGAEKLLTSDLVGVYEEFFSAYRSALAELGHEGLAEAIAGRQEALGAG